MARVTYLPKGESPLRGPEDEDIADQRDGSDALRERDQRLLVSLCPRVNVDVRLVLLRREHVGVTDGKAVGRRGALLEGGLRCEGRVQLVGVDANILGDLGPRRDGRSAHGREEGFGEHGLAERRSWSQSYTEGTRRPGGACWPASGLHKSRGPVQHEVRRRLGGS